MTRVGHLLARRGLQPLYEALDRVVLAGTNVGIGAGTKFSGERAALRQMFGDAESPIVVDVGANTGEYAADVLDVTAQRALVHCFEPSTTAYAQLEQRFAGNPRVIVHNVGLGARDQESPLYAEKPGSPLGSLVQRRLEYLGLTFRPVETVLIRRLDSVCSELGIAQIDLLKLDVEGVELDVLQGSRDLLAAGALRAIQFEFGGCNIASRTFFRDFWELLSPRYRLFRVLWNGLMPIDRYDERLERFLTTNYMAVHR